jgi:AraC-like DNA-binding protein
MPRARDEAMDRLARAVRQYARGRANSDGLAVTPVPGLRMMCAVEPRGPLHSIYRPLVCLILQGRKHMVVGLDERTFGRGDAVIVSADMPVRGSIVQATPSAPYLAVAVELEVALLREIAAGQPAPAGRASTPPLLVAEAHDAVLDCALRLMRLVDLPDAIPHLQPGIARELHYWLLAGEHGAGLRALALPGSNASRLAAAIAILRRDYRDRLAVGRLARAAGMSPTAFHVHFKQLTSLTPGQFQKRLRLVEARRLMVHDQVPAGRAAFEVGYQSASQFTREYARMFGAPPRRDSLRAAAPVAARRRR